MHQRATLHFFGKGEPDERHGGTFIAKRNMVFATGDCLCINQAWRGAPTNDPALASMAGDATVRDIAQHCFTLPGIDATLRCKDATLREHCRAWRDNALHCLQRS